MVDVARYAGVSVATVSRTLNRTAPVSPELRERIEAAVEALDYKPTVVRQGDHALPIKAVALLVTDILNPFFGGVVRGVEEEAALDDVFVILVNIAQDPQREEEMLHNLSRLQLEGIIIFGSRVNTETLIQVHEQQGIPIVVLDRRVDHPGIACILVDAENATYRAAKHLLNLHHSRIAYLAGPTLSASSHDRKRGLQRALAEEGLSLRPEWSPSGFPSVEGGFQAMSSLLTNSAERPTAVIAYNDLMALGAIQAIRSHGLEVPRDISIIGFDDINMAAHANPPLTTIAQPKYRMGKLAMQVVRRMRQDERMSEEGFMLLESPLIIRESTVKLPAAENGSA